MAEKYVSIQRTLIVSWDAPTDPAAWGTASLKASHTDSESNELQVGPVVTDTSVMQLRVQAQEPKTHWKLTLWSRPLSEPPPAILEASEKAGNGAGFMSLLTKAANGNAYFRSTARVSADDYRCSGLLQPPSKEQSNALKGLPHLGNFQQEAFGLRLVTSSETGDPTKLEEIQATFGHEDREIFFTVRGHTDLAHDRFKSAAGISNWCALIIATAEEAEACFLSKKGED